MGLAENALKADLWYYKYRESKMVLDEAISVTKNCIPVESQTNTVISGGEFVFKDVFSEVRIILLPDASKCYF